MGRGSWLVWLAALGCLEPVALAPVDLLPQTRSVLVGRVGPEGPALELIDRDTWLGRPLALSLLEGPVPLTLLEYEQTPEGLTLGRGSQILSLADPCAPEAEKRGLYEVESLRSPSIPQALRVQRFDPDVSARFEVGAPDSALAGVRLPAFDWRACARSGGCMSSSDAPRCVIPCAPLNVAAPLPPEPPEAPRCLGCADTSFAKRLTCPSGQAHFLGETGYTELGRVCPLPGEDWATAPPGEARYVRFGAVGGDGTPLRPFGTLDEALLASPAGASIMLSRGAHPWTAIDGPVDARIIGACVAETTLEASGDVVIAAPVTLENLGVRARSVGLMDAGRVKLSEVELRADLGVVGSTLDIERSRTIGYLALADSTLTADIAFIEGSTITAGRSVVRASKLVTVSYGSSVAFSADGQSRIELSTSLLERTTASGFISKDATLVLSDVQVALAEGVEPTGFGLYLVDSDLRAERVRIEGFAIRALAIERTVDDEMGSVWIRDLSAVGPSSEAFEAGGLGVFKVANVDIRRVELTNLRLDGLLVFEPLQLTLVDARVESLPPAMDVRPRYGVAIGLVATGTVARLSVQGADDRGIAFVDQDVRLDICSDLRVEGARVGLELSALGLEGICNLACDRIDLTSSEVGLAYHSGGAHFSDLRVRGSAAGIALLPSFSVAGCRSLELTRVALEARDFGVDFQRSEEEGGVRVHGGSITADTGWRLPTCDGWSASQFEGVAHDVRALDRED